MSRFLNIFPIWLVQSSPYFFPDILVEMSLFLDRKMRLLLPDPTLNVESVILVILSLILYNSLCYSDPSIGQGRQLAKYSEKVGVQKESVVVKERSKILPESC